MKLRRANSGGHQEIISDFISKRQDQLVAEAVRAGLDREQIDLFLAEENVPDFEMETFKIRFG
jgi:hypothetical protein